MSLRLAIPVILLVLPACDKGQQPPANVPQAASDTAAPSTDASGGDGGEGDTEPGAPGVPWGQKTDKQRQEYMGIVVLPKMKEMFKGHDDVEFKGFKCQTCHGDDMKDKHFEMPTDSIYPLPKENTIQAAMDYDAKVTKFMVEQVVPEMAKLLDEEPHDPQTNTGTFGCLSCHPTE